MCLNCNFIFFKVGLLNPELKRTELILHNLMAYFAFSIVLDLDLEDL